MSSFDWAQDQCSEIEYDVLNLENFTLGTNKILHSIFLSQRWHEGSATWITA